LTTVDSEAWSLEESGSAALCARFALAVALPAKLGVALMVIVAVPFFGTAPNGHDTVAPAAAQVPWVATALEAVEPVKVICAVPPARSSGPALVTVTVYWNG
jgi:hypothetical protein